jgi:hypothetical protein
VADPVSLPPLLGTFAFLGSLVAFVGLWLLMSWLLAALSGWTLLARRYRHIGPRPTGPRLSGQIIGLGPVNETRVTRLVLADEGLYLERNPLFRFGQPAVLVPWTAVEYVSEGKFLWRRWRSLELGGMTTLRVKDEAYEALAPYLTSGRRAPAA